jgi:hypothetical protein
MLLLAGATPNGPFRMPPRRPPARVRGPRLWAAIGLVGLAGAVVAAWWAQGEETRQLRALPEPQRAALYQRTIDNLRTICDPAPGRSLRDFCRSQAELALQFPECDDGCRDIARRHLSLPRR